VNYDAGEVKSFFIACDKQDQKITASAFASAWTRLKMKMEKAGIESFNFHGLKAKGFSGTEGEKLRASGHKDEKC